MSAKAPATKLPAKKKASAAGRKPAAKRPASTTILKVQARDLVRALDRIKRFAGPSELPEIHAVYISFTGTALTVTATNRFTVARQIVEYEQIGSARKPRPFTILVPLNHLQLIKAGVQRHSLSETVTLQAGEYGTLAVAGVTVGALDSIDFREKIDRILTETLKRVSVGTADPVTDISLNPDALKLFYGLGDRMMLRVTGTATQPVLVSNGLDFLGLIMPMRPLWDTLPDLAERAGVTL